MSAQSAPASVASLPMYDLPSLREATDELWRAIAAALGRRGITAPAVLQRSGASIEAVWTDPNLLLSQTCAYPLMTLYRDRMTVVGAPVYRAAGCEGPFHRAAIIVNASSPATDLADLKGRRCAVNDRQSNTGMNLLRAEISRLADGQPFFRQVIYTGSHAMSLWCVAEDEADVASIDPVTLALLQRHHPWVARRVRTLQWTSPSPGLPFVTSRRQSFRVTDALRHALAEAVQSPALRATREALLLEEFVSLPQARYEATVSLAREAAARGYAELR
jgi:ABC-type phosphate/phosphonate transport system substrate-binding protein